MWFFNKTKNRVGIALDSNSLKFSVITTDQANIYTLRLYQDYKLTHNEMFDGLIFNPTQLCRMISQFLQENKLKNITAAISLSANLVPELLTPEDMHIDHRFKLRACRSCPLLISGHKYSYCAALSHEFFFQLQIIFEALNIKISTLTTENMVLYNLFYLLNNNFCNQEPVVPGLFTNPPDIQNPIMLNMSGDITTEALRDFLFSRITISTQLQKFINSTQNSLPELTYMQILQALGLYLINTHETI